MPLATVAGDRWDFHIGFPWVPAGIGTFAFDVCITGIYQRILTWPPRGQSSDHAKAGNACSVYPRHITGVRQVGNQEPATRGADVPGVVFRSGSDACRTWYAQTVGPSSSFQFTDGTRPRRLLNMQPSDGTGETEFSGHGENVAKTVAPLSPYSASCVSMIGFSRLPIPFCSNAVLG